MTINDRQRVKDYLPEEFLESNQDDTPASVAREPDTVAGFAAMTTRTGMSRG